MVKKIIKDENGKEFIVSERKPFYKKWWFWLLTIIVLFILFITLGASDDSTNTSSPTEKSSSVNSKLKNNYKINQEATYNGYSFKVNSVKYWTGDDIDTPDNGKKYVIVNVTITNKGASKQDYNPYDFKLNENGNAVDLDEIVTNNTYGKNTLNSGTLDKGAAVSGNLIAQAPKNSKLKLEYQPSFFDDKTIDVKLN